MLVSFINLKKVKTKLNKKPFDFFNNLEYYFNNITLHNLMNMLQNGNRSLDEYRILESNLHRELINCCRKYLNELGIVSIVGLVDIVKQEIMELEKATKTNVERDGPEVSQNQRY
jgi:hypothetical protein